MPYVSKAQVGYMHANVPKVARKWDKKYGVKKNLPQHAERMKRIKEAAHGK